MEDSLYLAFADEIGRDGDNWLYRFDFTIDTNVVWGTGFNVVPAASVPKMQPDKNCLAFTSTVSMPRKMELAKRSTCYSMQDCIDGIIPLCFTRLDSEALMIDKDTALSFHFGEAIEKVREKIELFGGCLDIQEIEKERNSAIDNLIKEGDDNGDN